MAFLFVSVDEQRAALKQRLTQQWPDFRTGGDHYRDLIRESLRPSMTVLDAGCGRGGIIAEFARHISHLIGVDQDADAVHHNPYLHERHVADLTDIPLPDQTVDVVIGEFVIEHLVHPGQVLAELRRVLRRDGRMIFLTSNRNHPMMRVSHLTPTWLHRSLKRRLLHKTEDVFPTRYRMNTPIDLRRHAEQSQLRVVDLRYASNPEYLAVGPWATSLAVTIERQISRRWPERQMYLVVCLEKK